MRFNGVIFDLDGTLLDTLEDLADAANAMLEESGFPTHPTEAYRYFVGEGVRMLVRRALPEDRSDDETIEKSTRIMRRQYQRFLNAKTRPYDGISELLGKLKSLDIRIGVLTNKPSGLAEQCLREYFENGLFDMVLGQQDGLPRKPDPAGARQIAAAWHLAADRILFLGDTSTDMTTALRAGMFAVGALWGFRTREELERHGASQLIATPMDLMTLFIERSN